MTQVYPLAAAWQRRAALDAVRLAPDDHMVQIGKQRTSRENAHYHVQIRAIAAQDTLDGTRLDEESWKRLLVNAFRYDTEGDAGLAEAWRAFGPPLLLLPALNNPGFVAVGDLTRNFPSTLARAFSAWLYAWGVERGIEWPDAISDKGQPP